MITNIRISLIVVILILSQLSRLYGQVDDDIEEYYEEEYEYEELGPINFLNFGVQIVIPQQALKRNHPRVFGGVYLNYFRQYKTDSPLFIGGNIGYCILDSYDDQVERVFDTFTEIWNGSTTSSIIDFSVNAKYFLNFRIGPIEPYMEFVTGANWFYTRTSFDFPDSDESDSKYEKGDIVLTYGGAMGFMINIKDNTYLDCNVGYYPGLSATYFVEKRNKEPLYNSTIQGFDLKKSTTDMLKIKLGVNFAF